MMSYITIKYIQHKEHLFKPAWVVNRSRANHRDTPLACCCTTSTGKWSKVNSSEKKKKKVWFFFIMIGIGPIERKSSQTVQLQYIFVTIPMLLSGVMWYGACLIKLRTAPSLTRRIGHHINSPSTIKTNIAIETTQVIDWTRTTNTSNGIGIHS